MAISKEYREGTDAEQVLEASSSVAPPLGIQRSSPPREIHGIKWAIAYASMLSTTFLFAVDNTITADIQPSIINTLGHTELLPWVGTGFALGGLAILAWGKCYTIWDMKTVYLVNIALFEAGSAVCGAAPSTTALIAGRIVAGAGGCGIYSGTLNYVSVLTSARERPAYLAGSTAVWGLGSVLGPVIGGAFATSAATWRWGFYINLVVGALFAPAYVLLFPSIDPQPGRTLRQRCGMVDWPMNVVFLAGSACFVMAISFGGVVFPWGSASEIVLWTFSGVLLIASIVLTRFHPGVAKKHRLYPAHYLKRPILVNLQLQMFLSSGIILAMTYYIPLFFQFTRGDGPLDAGVRLLPLIISMVVFSMINGSLMPRFSLISPWYIIGSALVLIGCSLMYTVDQGTPNQNIYSYTTLVGVGAGCYIVAGVALIQALVPAEETSDAVGAMAVAQTLGMATFLSASGTLFQNVAVRELSAISDSILPPSNSNNTSAGDASSAISDLIAGTSSAAYQALAPPQREAVASRVAAAMADVWLFFLAAAALSFALSVFLVKLRIAPPTS